MNVVFASLHLLLRCQSELWFAMTILLVQLICDSSLTNSETNWQLNEKSIKLVADRTPSWLFGVKRQVADLGRQPRHKKEACMASGEPTLKLKGSPARGWDHTAVGGSSCWWQQGANQGKQIGQSVLLMDGRIGQFLRTAGIEQP